MALLGHTSFFGRFWVPFVAGLIVCVAYNVGWLPSVGAGILIFYGCTLWGMLRLRITELSLLSRFMILLYAMPFSTLIGIAFIHNFDALRAGALDLVLDPSVAGHVIVAGLVGLLGLVAGMGAGELRLSDPPDVRVPRRTLGLSLFVPMLVAAVALGGISVRTTTLSGGGYYTDALEAAQKGGAYGTLYVVAYMTIALLFIDALRDANLRQRRWKATLILGATAYIVVFQQLLLGNRDVLGLLIALATLYITGAVRQETANSSKDQWNRVRKLIPIGVLTVTAFLAVGQLRYSGAEGYATDSSIVNAAIREVAKGGTWTAVLLGNIAIANEYATGTLEFLGGKTYLDYLLSLPPSFITRTFGIVRPLEAESGPGLWYYPLQWGSAHPVLVPFRNFGIWGVLIVLTLVGWLIARCEALNQTGTFWSRLFYGTFFVASFSWFWYGDMPFIRYLMAAGALGLGYQLLLSLKAPSLTGPRPATQNS